MKLTYDPKHNIAYMKLREKDGMVDTISVSSELNIDLSPDGKIYGIELLNANEQLKGKDEPSLLVVNEESNQTTELHI